MNRRYLAAPAATAANLIGAALGVAGVVGIAVQAPPAVTYLTLGFAIPAVYLAGVAAAAALLARDLPLGVRWRVPAVLATMHMTWGLGFLTSPRKFARKRA